MSECATMGTRGTNNVAAALMARRIQSGIPGAVTAVHGEGMDCSVDYVLPGGEHGNLRTYQEWLAFRERQGLA